MTHYFYGEICEKGPSDINCRLKFSGHMVSFLCKNFSTGAGIGGRGKVFLPDIPNSII